MCGPTDGFSIDTHRLLASGHRVELLLRRASDETREKRMGSVAGNKDRTEDAPNGVMRQYLLNKNFSVTCTYLINKMNKIPTLLCRRWTNERAHLAPAIRSLYVAAVYGRGPRCLPPPKPSEMYFQLHTSIPKFLYGQCNCIHRSGFIIFNVENFRLVCFDEPNIFKPARLSISFSLIRLL